MTPLSIASVATAVICFDFGLQHIVMALRVGGDLVLVGFKLVLLDSTLRMVRDGDLAWNVAWLAYLPIAGFLRRRGARG